jgi:D-3-phosphoglycerate dehydrogenase
MTTDDVIVFVDADPPMMPLMVGERRARLEALGAFTLYEGLAADAVDYEARISNASAIMIGWDLPVDIMRKAPRLEVISYLGTGAANMIDLPEAAARGITVSNTPGYGDNAVAEHALALLFAVARDIPRLDRTLRTKGWNQLDPGFELRGKKLGLIGLGGIGSRMAELARALGMEVLAWTRNPSPERARRSGVTFAPLETVLGESDVISLHLLLTPETQNLLGAAELDRMKPGAVFINTARAELVDEAALIARLRAGRIAAAGIDVYLKEPLPKDHPLLGLDNVVATPHVGFNTPEATMTMVDFGIDNLVQYFAGDPINVVAAPGKGD